MSDLAQSGTLPPGDRPRRYSCWVNVMFSGQTFTFGQISQRKTKYLMDTGFSLQYIEVMRLLLARMKKGKRVSRRGAGSAEEEGDVE
jgi:hypothetical protein